MADARGKRTQLAILYYASFHPDSSVLTMGGCNPGANDLFKLKMLPL